MVVNISGHGTFCSITLVIIDPVRPELSLANKTVKFGLPFSISLLNHLNLLGRSQEKRYIFAASTLVA